MHELREYALEKFNATIYKDHATDIEKNIFNVSIRRANNYSIDKKWTNFFFKDQYKRTFLRVYRNLITNNNADELRSRIEKNIIDIKKIAEYSPEQLAPTKWANAKLEIQRQTLLKKPKKEDIPDGIFFCTKCKLYKTDYYAIQTRSADEPMTNYIQCLLCDKRWKN